MFPREVALMGLAWDIELAGRRRMKRQREQVMLPPGYVVTPETERIRTGEMVRPIVTAYPSLKIYGIKYHRGQHTVPLPLDLVRRLEQHGHVWLPRGSGVDWWTARGRVLAVEPCAALPRDSVQLPGALRIASLCAYDPGNAGYRLHSAVNEYTPHASAFIAWRERSGNPFNCPEQYNGLVQNKHLTRAMIYEADVLHNHVAYGCRNVGLGNMPRLGQTLIRHYHGSRPYGEPQHPIVNAQVDDALGAVLFGARLTLCALRPDRMQWLPIPMPVERYKALVPKERQRGKPVWRIAHSATKEEYKGTALLCQAVDELRKSGLPVEVVLIGYKRNRRGRLEPDRRSHAEALQIKAGCDITFDSLWLGIQGSGLEAAAMGQAVIAGDFDVRALYEKEVGYCPYTFADGVGRDAQKKALKEQIERLVTDEDYYREQAAFVHAYVLAYHDYPAVATRYCELLAQVRGDLPKLPAPKPDRRSPVKPPKRRQVA